MADLMDRKVAMNALFKWMDDRGDDRGLIDVICDLPSAQSTITCDGCKYAGTCDTDLPCRNCIRREKDYYEPER